MGRVLHNICLATSVAIVLLASNHVTGYVSSGSSSRTTQPPTEPPPPKYQNDRDQWDGPTGNYEEGSRGSPQRGTRPPSDRRQPGSSSQNWNNDNQGRVNNFGRQRHVERYGFPEGCVHEANPRHACNYFVDIAKEEDHPESLHFELSGRVPETGGYVAMGLSRDRLMGQDHIVECVLPASGPGRQYQSWSTSRSQPVRLPDNIRVIAPDDRYPIYDNGILTCKFRRPMITHVDADGEQHEYDLERGKYHVLLSTGELQFPKQDSIGYHGNKQLGTVNAYASPGLLGSSTEKYSPLPPTASDEFSDRFHNSGNYLQSFSAQAGFVMMLAYVLGV